MTSKQTYTTTFARYSVSRIIGEGGSGIVYEVLDEEGDRKALKVLRIEIQGFNPFSIRFPERSGGLSVLC